MRLPWRRRTSPPPTEADRKKLTGEHGAAWGAFIERQLKDEQERFGRLDDKGAGLVTSSGTLVAFIFAIGALVVNRTGFQPNRLVVALAGIGLILFVGTALAGLVTTRVQTYKVAGLDSLENVRTDRSLWKRTEPYARNLIAWWDIDTLKSIRGVNEVKARWLRRGQYLQIAATVVLAASASIALGSPYLG